MQIVADFKNQPRRFSQRRRNQLRKLGQPTVGGQFGKRTAIGRQGGRRNLDSSPSERFDEQRPSKPRRVFNLVRAHQRLVGHRDSAANNLSSREARDGVRHGYDIAQLAAVRRICKVPLVASGGAGRPEHFAEVFNEACVDGALAVASCPPS